MSSRGKYLVELAQKNNIEPENSSEDEATGFSDDSLADAHYEPPSSSSSETDVVDAHEGNPISEVADATEDEVSITRRPKRGRKRKYENQTRVIKKKNRNSNKSYYNYKGVHINPKKFENYECRDKCHEKVSVEERRTVFKKYWELGSYDAQTAYLGTLITEQPTKRQYTQQKENPKRKFTRIYKINSTTVCRNLFIKTLKISTKRVHTALLKIKSDSIVDKRGNRGGCNKLSIERFNEVINHIKKIPKYKSHYRRVEAHDVEYLESHMTIEKMHQLYAEEVNNPVSYEKYKRIFYSNFNLRRKPLKKDTCNLCDKMDASIKSAQNNEDKEKFTQEHTTHLNYQEEARNKMNDDMERAKEDETLEVLTFDMEKTLHLPRIPTNVIFYKRQIWLYNTGIHSCKFNQAFCYTWVEGCAGRGAQEVGSCLLKHIKLHIPETVKTLILWSDSCGGQNRNIKLILLLKAALESHPTLKTVSLRFLVSGHSFLKNDSDFSDIEKALKFQQRIYTADDYINIMKSCRKKKSITC